ncbi:hypothetical protein FOL47_002623, partial [Perkinsus chesapeaki]
GDPARSVQEYIDEGVSGLYQISDDNDDYETVLNSVADTPGIVISGGVLSHPSKCGSHYMETNGWLPVMGAETYRWRMRRLRPDEKKDTTEQIYCAEIDLPLNHSPEPRSTRNKRDYTWGLFKKLKGYEMEAFKEEISRYLDNEWWHPARGEKVEGPSLLVFPLPSPGRSTRCRPIIDARDYNRRLPTCSYSGPTITQVVNDLRLRWRPHSRILTADCAQAFYRVRLLQPVSLSVQGLQYLSWRLVFGLGIGPSGLYTVLAHLLSVAYFQLSAQDQALLLNASFYIYLDDITIMVPRDASRAADHFLLEMEKVFLLAGFELPFTKRHDSDVDCSFQHLGLNWKFEDGNFFISCRKPIPLSIRLPDGSFNMKWTARLLLGIAGCGGTGVDPCRLHSDTRLAGDLLRSIAGKAAKHGMDKEVCIETDVNKMNVVSTCFGILEKASPDGCVHWCYGGSKLECYVDASPIGYGWCISVLNEALVQQWALAEHAGVWWGSKTSYHINRKELIAISSLVLYLHGMICGQNTCSPPIESIVIYADSQTALRWLEKRISSKSIEKVAVLRLVCCINELVSDIRTCGVTVTYKKIDGASNSADRLSRLIEKWGLVSSLGLGEVEPESLLLQA